MTRRALALAASIGLLAGCATPVPEYQHSRYDYWSFRGRAGRIPEPNYLPWALHEESLPTGGRGLVVCRWPDDAFPLRYHVAAPLIHEDMQHEFSPRNPEDYVEAVERAFGLWQDAIGRPVRFERVDDPARATLQIHMKAELHEMGEGHVLGLVRDEAGRCRVSGRSERPDQMRIEYAVNDMYLYVADAAGLLTPRQVEAVTLHELGHVLGVSGQHSPLQGDVMYRVAADRRAEVLSLHDTNTLRAMYALPAGSVYARTDQTRPAPMPEVKRGPPRLDVELHDERHDMKVRFPREWQVIRSPRGWIAVDGVSWDYDASIQVVASRGEFDTHGAARRLGMLTRGDVERTEIEEIDGQQIARVVATSTGRTEEITLIDWSDGWVVFVIADCRTEDYPLYVPWFRNVMLSLYHEDDATDAEATPPLP